MWPPKYPDIAAHDEGEDEADQHPDGADRERGPDRVQGAREDVLAGGIRAEDVDTALVDPEEVGLELKPAGADVECRSREIELDGEELILPSRHEEVHVAPLLGIDLV